MQALIVHVDGVNGPDSASEDPLVPIIDTLEALEKTVTEDFRMKCQSISNLVSLR